MGWWYSSDTGRRRSEKRSLEIRNEEDDKSRERKRAREMNVEPDGRVKKADEITVVNGVDSVQMGPLDLSASLDIYGIRSIRK